MIIRHDAFGNTATICPKSILPSREAKQYKTAYVLTLSADYDNNFVYHVSVHESEDVAIERMQEFSCGLWYY